MYGLSRPMDNNISLYVQRYVQNIPYSASFFIIGILANFRVIISIGIKNWTKTEYWILNIKTYEK